MGKTKSKTKEAPVMPGLIVNTAVLQDMVSRSIKGAGLNKLIPLTSFMSIRLSDKHLTLTTTDASNTLYIERDIDAAGEFTCVAQAEQIYKLVSKLTSETTTLVLDGSTLVVKSNGIYKIELPLDENGESIVFPDPLADVEFGDESGEIKLSTVKEMLSVNKAALATTNEEPAYTGYYVGPSRVMTTDQCIICGLEAQILEEPVLLAPETVNMLDVMTAESITIYTVDDDIVFKSDDCTVYGHVMDCIDDFAVDTIGALIDEEFASVCKIRRADLLSLLDRIALFVGQYDNHAITLIFTDKDICVSSKQSTGVESIPYVEAKKTKPYSCEIDISLLYSQLKANSADVLELQFGNDKSIKLVDGSVTQVIALLEQQ